MRASLVVLLSLAAPAFGQAPEEAATAPPIEAPPAYVGYAGPHPVPYEVGGGYCYGDGFHVHDYPPFDQNLFRFVDGYYYFIGDPVDFGYQGTTYPYSGNHPIPQAYGGGYCYITWPHRHLFRADIEGFTLFGGYYVYSGIFPADYYWYRNFYLNYFVSYYRPYYFANRYCVLRPPPIYAVPSPIYSGARGPTSVGPPPPYAPPGNLAAPGYFGNRAPTPSAGLPPTAIRPAVPPTAAPPVFRPAPSFSAPPPAFRPAPSFSAPPPAFRPAPSFHGGGGRRL